MSRHIDISGYVGRIDISGYHDPESMGDRIKVKRWRGEGEEGSFPLAPPRRPAAPLLRERRLACLLNLPAIRPSAKRTPCQQAARARVLDIREKRKLVPRGEGFSGGRGVVWGYPPPPGPRPPVSPFRRPPSPSPSHPAHTRPWKPGQPAASLQAPGSTVYPPPGDGFFGDPRGSWVPVEGVFG